MGGSVSKEPFKAAISDLINNQQVVNITYKMENIFFLCRQWLVWMIHFGNDIGLIQT